MPPAATEVEAGEIVTATAGAVLTVTVTVLLTEPAALVAVNVYAEVALGVTLMDVPVTVPIAGAMLRAVAPETDQFSVALPPGEMFAGEAVKPRMTGAAGVEDPLPNLPN